ncbi:pyridoxine 5-phosphate synthase [Sinobacterium caligoides]|uniref:Pyridoxine 5'-phosphate synthase n=1 Tax=Sinobacterium caligoides TaxID=933926 RepID=A0A3N2DY58_9GAMM|nr:pyridoxine 5'-phosphate synthase [Sinobacterium caligoides]ROS04758.1 pyridoxine 5-phosphate synthase [Sinobacterium caligoides]
MTALSINLNKIALIRNSRDTIYPCVVKHAEMCLAAGADGITVHPRPDQRHIRADDCFELANAIDAEFNIEGNPFAAPMHSNRSGVSDYPGFMPLIRQIKPAQCTLVPDSDSQLTSDHGFDLHQDFDRLKPIIDELKELGVRSSLFMDPIPEQIELAAKLGSDRIELYTGPYAAAFDSQQGLKESIDNFAEAARVAAACGIELNAGHDLNIHNLPLFCQRLPNLLEVSIGHAFTVDCIEMGLVNAVQAYRLALTQ